MKQIQFQLYYNKRMSSFTPVRHEETVWFCQRGVHERWNSDTCCSHWGTAADSDRTTILFLPPLPDAFSGLETVEQEVMGSTPRECVMRSLNSWNWSCADLFFPIVTHLTPVLFLSDWRHRAADHQRNVSSGFQTRRERLQLLGGRIVSRTDMHFSSDVMWVCSLRLVCVCSG